MQVGQLLSAYTPKKDIFFNLPSKDQKESFLGQILLSDLRWDTFELKQTKIRPICKLTYKTFLFQTVWCCFLNQNLVICFLFISYILQIFKKNVRQTFKASQSIQIMYKSYTIDSKIKTLQHFSLQISHICVCYHSYYCPILNHSEQDLCEKQSLPGFLRHGKLNKVQIVLLGV